MGRGKASKTKLRYHFGLNLILNKLRTVVISVKTGTPSDDDLEELANMLAENWQKVGRRLGIDQARITAYHKENEKLSEKAFKMLLDWKQSKGSDGTYQDLYDALCHKLVKCKLIAEDVCCDSQWLQPEK